MARTIRSALFALPFLAAGCSVADPNEPIRATVIATTVGVASPSGRRFGAGERVATSAAAQGLVRFDALGQIEPGVAERWTVIDDGRSYIFRLRDMQWADGARVTASQVVAILRRATAPGSRNAASAWMGAVDDIVEMTPQVIEIRLRRPQPQLLTLLAQPELAILRAGGAGGTGPFDPRPTDAASLLLRARTQAADGEGTTAHPVRLSADRAALAVAAFAAGRSDMVLNGGIDDWPLLAHSGVAQPNIRIDPAAGLFGLAFANRIGLLREPENRAAIAMAIDATTIVQRFGADWPAAATTLPDRLDSAAAPVTLPWTARTAEDRVAIGRAQIASWRAAGGEPDPLRIALPLGPGGTLLWGHIAASLRRIGLSAVRVPIDDSADLVLIDAVAPHDNARWYLVTACRSCDPAIGERLTAARNATDPDRRAQLLSEADAMLAQDVAYIPIARPLRWSLVSSRLNRWRPNTRAWHPLNHLRDDPN